MGTVKPKKKLINDVKVIDPKPVWVVSIITESGKKIDKFMQTEEAEKYMKAGHKVKLYTKAGDLRQYE